jgi:hypothetical protein
MKYINHHLYKLFKLHSIEEKVVAITICKDVISRSILNEYFAGTDSIHRAILKEKSHLSFGGLISFGHVVETL